MELISPTFADAKPKPAARPPARPPAAPSLAGFHAASVRWPLAFVLVGIVSLLVGGGLLLAQPELLATYHYTPHLLAVTHLLITALILSWSRLPATAFTLQLENIYGLVALLGLDGVNDVQVEVVWDPPWHPSMMTEVGRRMTGVRDF